MEECDVLCVRGSWKAMPHTSPIKAFCPLTNRLYHHPAQADNSQQSRVKKKKNSQHNYHTQLRAHQIGRSGEKNTQSKKRIFSLFKNFQRSNLEIELKRILYF